MRFDFIGQWWVANLKEILVYVYFGLIVNSQHNKMFFDISLITDKETGRNYKTQYTVNKQ